MRLRQLPIPDQLVEDLEGRENGKVTLVIDRGGQPAKVVVSRHCISVILVPTIVVVDDPWEYPNVVWESSLDKIVAVEIEREKGQQPVRWLRKHEKFDFLRVEGDLPEVELYSPHDVERPIQFCVAGELIDAAMEAARLESLEAEKAAVTETSAKAVVKVTTPAVAVITSPESSSKCKLTLSQAFAACQAPEANKRLKKVLARFENDDDFAKNDFVAMVDALL